MLIQQVCELAPDLFRRRLGCNELNNLADRRLQTRSEITGDKFVLKIELFLERDNSPLKIVISLRLLQGNLPYTQH